jgi:arginyl-tRNA---protein transferase
VRAQPYREYSSECNYCHQRGKGRWAYGCSTPRMTVDDYDALLERGWMRSGDYSYRPLNKRACCPNLGIK